MPRPVNVIATLRRIRSLAADLTRELALRESGRRLNTTLAAAIYAAADGALVALKPAKQTKRR
jgi:hypothetical protein